MKNNKPQSFPLSKSYIYFFHLIIPFFHLFSNSLISFPPNSQRKPLFRSLDGKRGRVLKKRKEQVKEIEDVRKKELMV